MITLPISPIYLIKNQKQKDLQAVKNAANEFGKKFIIIPNVGYGDWESSFYQYKYDYTHQKKDSLMYNAVKANP